MIKYVTRCKTLLTLRCYSYIITIEITEKEPQQHLIAMMVLTMLTLMMLVKFTYIYVHSLL